jgi:pimeloyl-ACP methyl ester carboxylesterase
MLPRRPQFWLLAALSAVLTLALAGVRSVNTPRPTYHSAFGKGQGPTIALVHGLGSRAEHWLPTARLLARRHRVVLVDLPGHGVTPMPEPFSLERAVESLDLALAEESREPMVLVGHSVGGLVATAEALAHPERVKALVLIETALKPQVEGAERDQMLAALDNDYQGLLRTAYTAFGRDSAQGAALYAEVATLDSARIKRWIRLALTADLTGPTARLSIPMLVVLAERSWPIGEAWEVTGFALGYLQVPRLTRVRVHDAGHFVMLDHPRQLAAAIERFIAHPDGEPIAAR